MSLLRISPARNGALELTGRTWQEDGTLSGRYWSEAVNEREDASGVFYYWKGERPLHRDAPQLEGTGRSGWTPPIAHRGTSRPVRTRTRKCTRGRPVSTGAPIRRIA